MKKVILFIFMIFPFLFISVSAEEVRYDPKVIDDNSSIVSDFEVLTIDINDYYPIFKETQENLENYDNFDKWYVIGMGENYEKEADVIQTYFYLYSPIPHQYKNSSDIYYLRNIQSLNYKLNGKENIYSEISIIDSTETGIIKVKGFSYSYCDKANIELSSMILFCCEKRKTITIPFTTSATHSKEDGFTIELDFNSTLIIDEMECVSLDVLAENNFSNWFFGNVSFKEQLIDKIVDKKLRLYFYNFNFPNNIQPDSIEYAKFSYYKEDWVKEEKRVNTGWSWKWEFVSDIKQSEEAVLSEYEPGTHKFQVGKSSEELEFATFVLGNRIEKEDHGYLTFTEEQKKHFNYDCSILLDSDYTIIRQWTNPASYEGRPDKQYTSYTKLKDINFIELWYKKDGIIYKCQTSTPTIPGDDNVGDVGSEDSWWKKLWGYMVKFGEMVLEACNLHGAPELVKGIVGCGLSFLCLVVGIVVAIVLLPHIIKLLIWLIMSPIRLVQKILSL